MHRLAHERGEDSRNHIVRCACGWAHANTRRACERRGQLHLMLATVQRWADPKRTYEMPMDVNGRWLRSP